jgi:hypothetical protein
VLQVERRRGGERKGGEGGAGEGDNKLTFSVNTEHKVHDALNRWNPFQALDQLNPTAT